MATRTRSKTPPPVPRNRLIPPAGLLLVALFAAIMGSFGIATGMLLGAVGTWMVIIGKHRYWKGAPEAGYVLVGTGVIILLVALFS